MKSVLFREALNRSGSRPTRGSGVKILQVLGSEFPNPLQPVDIAKRAGVPHEAAKKWLRRNTGINVESVGRGFYRASATLELLRRAGFEPLEVHGIQVIVGMSLTRGSPPSLGDFGNAHKGGSRRGEWEGRTVTVEPARAGYFVTVRATMQPLSVPEFDQFSGWLREKAGPRAVLLLENFDLNIDANNHRIRLKGLESVELGQFGKALWKIYNKKEADVLRFEACFHRAEVSLSDAARWLNQIATPPYDLSDQGLSRDEKREVV